MYIIYIFHWCLLIIEKVFNKNKNIVFHFNSLNWIYFRSDLMRLKRDPVPFISAEPNPANILEWWVVVFFTQTNVWTCHCVIISDWQARFYLMNRFIYYRYAPIKIAHQRIRGYIAFIKFSNTQNKTVVVFFRPTYRRYQGVYGPYKP